MAGIVGVTVKSRPLARSRRQMASGVWPGVDRTSSVRPPRLTLKPSWMKCEILQGPVAYVFGLNPFGKSRRADRGQFRLRVFTRAFGILPREIGVHAINKGELPVAADVVVVGVRIENHHRTRGQFRRDSANVADAHSVSKSTACLMQR